VENKDINFVGNRRQFFRTAARCGVGAIIGIGIAAIGYKRRRLISEGKCVNRGICDNCEVFGVCDLPFKVKDKV
jgi:hypothetical protein